MKCTLVSFNENVCHPIFQYPSVHFKTINLIKKCIICNSNVIRNAVATM